MYVIKELASCYVFKKIPSSKEFLQFPNNCNCSNLRTGCSHSVFCFMLVCWTYISLLIRETHVCVPDLEAVLQARELHLLDFHPEISLQTLHHLQNNPTFQFQLSWQQELQRVRGALSEPSSAPRRALRPQGAWTRSRRRGRWWSNAASSGPPESRGTTWAKPTDSLADLAIVQLWFKGFWTLDSKETTLMWKHWPWSSSKRSLIFIDLMSEEGLRLSLQWK